MNLYLRLLWTLLRSWRLPPLTIEHTLKRTMRVLPNDLDINGHMNNGRYLTTIDLLLSHLQNSGSARDYRPEGG